MVWCPEELKLAAENVNQTPPPKVTVRKLLSWFNAERRGVNVVGFINAALRELGIQTVPSFEDAWIDAEIEFRPATPAVSTPAPVAATVGNAPSAVTAATATNVTTAPATATRIDAPSLSIVVSRTDRDPVHRIGKLDAANRKPEVIHPDAELQEAVTLMLLRDFSQLPVMSSEYSRRGMVSWRSIGKHAGMGGSARFVRECLEDAEFVGADDNVFDVVPVVMLKGCVLVLNAQKKLQGIVTAADLTGQFGTLLEPFLLIGEIENHIRLLLDDRLSLNTIQSGRDPADVHREVRGAADLTFGEYRRLLEQPGVWEQLKVPVHRGRFLEEIEPVREIRNDVMHFTPEGIGATKLASLRKFASFLRELSRARSASS